MMNMLEKIDGLPIRPVSDGADKQNALLLKELPFKVHRFKSRTEHNGWIVPDKWEVKTALIKKDGKVIYDGTRHPLGVWGYAASFSGRVSLEELKKHLAYKEDAPDALVNHLDFYYKPFARTWGFSVPYSLYNTLTPGAYDIELKTSSTVGEMKVLEYTHKGSLSDTIVFNAHNCHAAQLNDGPAGFVVFMEALRRLSRQKTRYTYRLIIAPEHLGTVFYLASLPARDIKKFKQGIFMEMVGHNEPRFALQHSFTGAALIDRVARHVLKHKSRGFWEAPFRKIVGNDETVWEAPGIEVPMISLSRVTREPFLFREYHLSTDNFSLMNESQLEEAVRVIESIVDVFERDAVFKRRFTGLVALSNPKYNLYRSPGTDPSMKEKAPEELRKWNYLMDMLPRYFDGKTTVFEIAEKYDLPFDEVLSYIERFEKKGLVIRVPICT